ncbi:hypothetical protein SAMN05421831_10838 [Allopseudospirillum japonicum]|uniref:DUF4190 domain-containing protein n=2 Tax=Allopseudospirillum japonicum TaxID=64971 RepID=A0A1H6SSU4_9GAMM|nr:hypothetical protein SAMN05421831_10838 [Allopseudospirillum japonicum]
MQGEIIRFDLEQQSGVVQACDDGQHYPFQLAHWRSGGLPSEGLAVHFEVIEQEARMLIRSPQKQMQAQGITQTKDTPPISKNSDWALVAIILAMASLIFGPILVPLVWISAGLGWREIRKLPEVYQGKGFIAAAVILSCVVIILTLSFHPQPAPTP